jgi:hypothetical protein
VDASDSLACTVGRQAGRGVAVVAAITVVSAFSYFLTAARADAKRVHIRGTAYEFNNSDVRLRAATIRLAEKPRLRAITKPDGSYDLAVPDHTTVTPYISAAGHHSIYLQTFRTAGEDLTRVNFQTPTEEVYRALAALLAVPLEPNGELRDCAIVSTFSTRNVRDLSFRGFTEYGAHGVAGATAFATPALPPPIYFNEDVIPDRAQQRSSVDGGVLWTRVPAGSYRIRARHPSTRFASFVATCAPGRVVNANPPWGLHELGEAMTATVSARWSVRGAEVTLRRLRAAQLPPGATVLVRCIGRRCPFTRRTATTHRGTRLDLLDALGPAVRRFRAGQTVEVLVTAHGYAGKLVRWRLRSGQKPTAVTRCVPLGNTKPQPRC